jgi:hypothetical protein
MNTKNRNITYMKFKTIAYIFCTNKKFKISLCVPLKVNRKKATSERVKGERKNARLNLGLNAKKKSFIIITCIYIHFS